MLAIIEQAAGSDTGLHRHANEDSYLVRPPVFLVADGMGGAQAGEVASQLATEVFLGELGTGRPEQLLKSRIETANEQIHRLARTDASLAGMGTTLTAAVLVDDDEEVVVGHVGDSRVYRLRGGRLEQLTRDHSLVEEMRRKGQITDEQAETHPQRSIITRALGPEPVVQVDVQTVAANAGDIFLLCSDGLTTMLDDGRIQSLLVGATSLEAAVTALIAEANRAGGRDNITVVTFAVGGPGDIRDGAGARSRAGDHPTVIGASARAEGLEAGRIRAAARRDGAAPKSRGRKRLLRRTLKGLAALVVVGALAYGALWGARQVWFLGTDEGGRVALYQGLPYELPFGIHLYSERYSIPIQTASLSPRRQETVREHDLRSHDDASSLIADILAGERPEAGSGAAATGATGTTGATGATGATGTTGPAGGIRRRGAGGAANRDQRQAGGSGNQRSQGSGAGNRQNQNRR